MTSQVFRIKNGISVGVGGTILTTSSQGNIGINSLIPTSRLSVVGNANVSGIVTANTFVGDGSSLYGVIGVGSGVDIWIGNTPLGTASAIDFSNEFSVLSISNGNALIESALTLDSITSAGRNLTQNSISVGDVIAGTVTATSGFVGYGYSITNVNGTYLSSYSSASNTSNYSLSLSGITTYTQVGILSGSSATDSSDNFGLSVAMSANGNTMVVGAPYDTVTLGLSTYLGTAHVFDRSGYSFTQVATLYGPTKYNQLDTTDLFGDAVKITADGLTVLVSAPNEDVGIQKNGSVYVYDRVGNNSFNQVGILTSLSIGQFGPQICCSAYGNLIFVRHNNKWYETGADYQINVFERIGSTFNRLGIITGSLAYHYNASTYTEDEFGISMACSADGNTLYVGSRNDSLSPVGIGTYGLVYAFDRVGNAYQQVGIITGSSATNSFDHFGHSLACSADGRTVIVGALYDEVVGIGTTTDYGVVYVFDRNGNSFTEVAKLTGNDPDDFIFSSGVNVYGDPITSRSTDQYGSSVACSADGNIIAIGAPRDEPASKPDGELGLVYVYNRLGNSFNQVGILTGSLSSPSAEYYSPYVPDYFGNSISMSADGRTILVGAFGDELPSNGSGSGLAYVFDQQRSTYLNTNSVGNIGIGSTTPTSKLTVQGDARFSGVVTATTFYGTLIGSISTASYSSTAGVATYATTAGIATYVINAPGIATVSQGLTGTPNIDVGNIIALGATFSNDVSILGTLNVSTEQFPYMDVVGILTARSGLLVGSPTSIGATISSNGNASFAGIVTATGGFNIGIQTNGINVTTGVITALNFVGAGNSFTYNAGSKTVNINTSNEPVFAARQSAQGTTSSIGIGSVTNLTIPVAKTYMLHQVGVSTAAWVRIYTDSSSRELDASRSETIDPEPGSGVVAEVITTGISTIALMTPSIIGFNNDSPPNTNVYLSITNKGTSAQPIVVNLTYLSLEN